MSPITQHAHVGATRLWTLKSQPLHRAPRQGSCIHQNVTRRQIQLPQCVDQIAKRGGSLVRCATWRCLGGFIRQGNTDFSLFYHTVVHQPKRTRKDFGGSFGEEKFVIRQQFFFHLKALCICLLAGQLCPIQTTLRAGKWSSLAMERPYSCSTKTRAYQGDSMVRTGRNMWQDQCA